MFKTGYFKLASRIACLAILISAGLWLNARAEASFGCVLSANNSSGGMVMITCGTSGGDFLWSCSNGSCTSSPDMDYAASQACASAAANGCPDIVYYSN
ncbi:MAG TPA: hypothetical protein VE961_24910 [Pyrinomonadaceae bacterium]|nr:hypothetical protein [Pyrinomonadaceae bacterium]